MVGKTLLFDLDGTLWDSNPWYAQVLEERSGVAREAILKDLSNGGNIVELTRRLDISDTCFKRSCENESLNEYLYDGVQDTLIRCCESGIPIGIVTNLPGRIAAPMLKSAGISSVISSSVFAARKPSPVGIRKALTQLGSKVDSDVIYIGDTFNDYVAATRANINFAWASYGYGKRAGMRSVITLTCIQDILEL